MPRSILRELKIRWIRFRDVAGDKNSMLMKKNDMKGEVAEIGVRKCEK